MDLLPHTPTSEKKEFVFEGTRNLSQGLVLETTSRFPHVLVLHGTRTFVKNCVVEDRYQGTWKICFMYMYIYT